MSLIKEIERKWLVDMSLLDIELEKLKSKELEQAYISFSPTVRIRSCNGEKYILCVKTKPDKTGLSRQEFETEISRSDYEFLLKKREGNIVKKTRYFLSCSDGKVMEIDVFRGELSGLCYMEIEFESIEEALNYKAPKWAYRDVSNDKKYKNSHLAAHGIPKV